LVKLHGQLFFISRLRSSLLERQAGERFHVLGEGMGCDEEE
jgi:hypothetical protein